jgi:hypothetical protein
MSRKAFGALLCSIAICALAAHSTKAADEAATKDGIEGKIVKADVEKNALTISTKSGQKQTFTVTNDTTIVGPRGGIVHKRLEDPRFHPGLTVTVVAKDDVAQEIHLSVDRGSSRRPSGRARMGFRGRFAVGGSASQAAPQQEAEDENEFPGTIKSVNAEKNILVVRLLTGKNESFMVSKDAKVKIDGTPSEKGLADAKLTQGTAVIVITENGNKVKEVRATAKTAKKAG